MEDHELYPETEPGGTIPVVGDYVVCIGDSTWREEGKPYLVVQEDEFDVHTEGGFWDKKLFAKLPEDPKVYISRYYRVCKRK